MDKKLRNISAKWKGRREGEGGKGGEERKERRKEGGR